jgi:hypothetical protein
LCWNLNALLQKIGGGNRGQITISWMVKPVTAIARLPPQNAAGCCSFVPDAPLDLPKPTLAPFAHHEIATCAATVRSRLRDKAAGRKIAPLHKKSKREVTHAKQSPD